MMVKYLVLAAAIAAILGCGQNDPLANYEPRSPQEKALKQVLLKFEDGVNTQDAEKIANLIHAKASIMTGRERTLLSKAEYIKILPQRLADNPPIALGRPKMSVSGDMAEVKIYMKRGDYRGLVVFNMTLDHNAWTIQGWKY